MTAAPLAQVSEPERERAWSRWRLIAPCVEGGVPLTKAATHAGVPVSTARRWLAAYRADGLAGLTRAPRSDRGTRRTQSELVALIEGLALRRPRPSAATIARGVAQVAGERGWPAPSYSTVASIVAAIDPALLTLAHDGPEAFRDRYELAFRRQAQRPNDVWQADHTQLDVLIVDANAEPARPWLTLVLDDHSRAVAGYSVFLGAPSALNLSLALRQAIWHKPDPDWPVHGVPDMLHVDHGSDFISHHLAHVAADLHLQLVHSTIARPQGRGKVERLFGTITTELLPELPGHLAAGVLASSPALTLADLDAAIGRWILGTYHQRTHPETRATPHDAWIADGWLPRTPDTVDALDLLLVMVATPRTVHRDGIRFQGLRYLHPALAGHVGRAVTVRYDPRDVTSLRVFLDDGFLCTAVSHDHAGQTVTLKDIQAARAAHRKALRAQLTAASRTVAEYLPRSAAPPAPATPARPVSPPPSRPPAGLHVYREDAEPR